MAKTYLPLFESALGRRQRLYSGEAAVDQEDKIVVPPRKEPEVEKKKNGA
ncbi:hypothetical protein Bca4012_096213 [Brassica carinata]